MICKIMYDISIRPRLLWFAERVRNGVMFADIGTDHAKLPVYLIKKGKINKAIASDIGEGPIARARTYIALNGLSQKIDTYIGDGIAHLDIDAPCDIAICGMGGETIINIIEGASLVKNSNIRLMLQPMTDFTMLRKYLADNGFFAVEEDIVESDGRMYQCMIVEYRGTPYTLTDSEAELGKKCIENRSDTFIKYVKRRYNIVKKCADGKAIAGIDAKEEVELLAQYNKILKGEI